MAKYLCGNDGEGTRQGIGPPVGHASYYQVVGGHHAADLGGQRDRGGQDLFLHLPSRQA